MAKVLYKGDSKRKFEWTSLGKAYTYVVAPGNTLNIPDDQLIYILSFGNFEVVTKKVQKIEKNKILKGSAVKVQVVKEEKPTEASVIYRSNESKIEIIKPLEDVQASIDISCPTEEKKIEENPVVEPAIIEIQYEEPIVKLVPKPLIPQPIKIDYTSLKKNELRKMCKDRGLDTKGNRDDLIANLVLNDRS